MHEIALLKAKVRELWEANATLSKRRKAKKKYLRNKGSLTAQDAKDLVDQQRVERELREKRSRRRAQQQHIIRGARRCKRCGASGHNARTCIEDGEEAVESSIEVAN